MIDSSLPIYPSEIRGTVRHILILKDFFILCSDLLERYCRFGGLASRHLNRDFILTEIQVGYDAIELLKGELTIQQKIKMEMEQSLIDAKKELILQGAFFGNQKPVVVESLCHQLKYHKMKMKLGIDTCIDIYYNKNDAELILPEPFDCQKMKTVLEFLQELFLIQLHFHVVLIQGLNFALPLLINGYNFLDRLLYWPLRPEFGMIHKKINLTDKLRDIQVELQRLVEELVSACLIVEAKFLYDQKLEKYFNKTIENQCYEKQILLEKIQFEKEILDLLQVEHNRLIGLRVKQKKSFEKRTAHSKNSVRSKNRKSHKDSIKENDQSNKSSVKSNFSNDLTEQSIERLPNLNKFDNEHVKFVETIKPKHPKQGSNKQFENNNVFESVIKLPEISTNNYSKFNSTSTSNDKTIETLLDLSTNFNFNFNYSKADFIEPKSKKNLTKMHDIVNNIVDKDWNNIEKLNIKF